MDIDFKPPNQENGTKNDAEISQKVTSPDVDTNGTRTDSPKLTPKTKRGKTRSRSRTPQNKAEEAKKLQINLKKVDKGLNGKDLIKETEKTDEKHEVLNVVGDGKKKEEPAKIDMAKSEEDENKKDKSKKQKVDTVKETCTEAETLSDDKKKGDEENLEETKKDSEILKKEQSVKTDVSKKQATPKKGKKDKKELESNDVEPESVVEMDPLVISDEPDPELQFDENSDLDSGKGSPVIPRCMTRRSQTRNIPTPKTPRSADQDGESEKNSVAPTPTDLGENDTDVPVNGNHDTNDSIDTIANVSTRAMVGSDATRMDYVENNHSNLVDESYLNASRERSLSETLRGLSGRRPIRNADEYRQRAMRSNQEKSDLNVPYPSFQVSTGTKRKGRSVTPEEKKKFKTESPGLFSSPLTNIRNKFRSDLPSSTPKLLGYRHGTSEFNYGDDKNFGNTANGEERKSWCSIM